MTGRPTMTTAQLARTPVFLDDHNGRRWRVLLDVWVDGDPATQGSHKLARAGFRAGGKPIVVPDNNDALMRWRGDVERRARQAIGHRWRANPLDGEVFVVLDFVLRRPPPNPRRVNDPLTYKHDGDKLHRSVGDALTDAGVYADDGHATSWGGSKRLAELGEHPGARIRVAVPCPVEVVGDEDVDAVLADLERRVDEGAP